MVNFADTITSIQIDYENHKVFVTGRCKAKDMQRQKNETNQENH
jgi:hypothetical protein